VTREKIKEEATKFMGGNHTCQENENTPLLYGTGWMGSVPGAFPGWVMAVQVTGTDVYGPLS
jgi:hypothetical protein